MVSDSTRCRSKESQWSSVSKASKAWLRRDLPSYASALGRVGYGTESHTHVANIGRDISAELSLNFELNVAL